MTLLVTEVGRHGVAMVAESAIRSEEPAPSTGKPVFRLTYGARKIVPFPRLHCAVGIWGMGAVETKEFASTPDVWVADFLERRGDVDSIRACAEALAGELKTVLKEPDRPFGFQVAGCQPGQPPEFWEATNVDPLGSRINWTHPNLIEHADALRLRLPHGDVRLARGLNYGTGALGDLDQVTRRLVGNFPELEGVYAGLRQRADYLSACVRFLCDFERADGNERISIGGETPFATIDGAGVIHFKPPYGEVSRIN